VPNGALLEGADHARALRLLHEAARGAAAAGFRFGDTEIEADFERVVRSTAANRSSMLQDLDHGRRTEIDAISGELLRAAASSGIDLPETKAILAELAARANPQPS
jgi:2-dehydropantoate 2-reductase